MSTTAGVTATAIVLVTIVLPTGVPLLCTVPTTTGLVAWGVGPSLTVATAGNVTTAVVTTLVGPQFVRALLGLELIATGPLAPAATPSSGPRVTGLAVTSLPGPTPDTTATVLITGIAELVPLPELLLLPPLLPPQAVIKIDINTAMIAAGLQVFRCDISKKCTVKY